MVSIKTMNYLFTNPKNADGWYSLGSMQKDLKKYTAAIESYDIAIELNSDNEKAKEQRASTIEDAIKEL